MASSETSDPCDDAATAGTGEPTAHFVLRGRSQQMDQVLRAAALVRRSRRGAVVLVAGEPGIGKTAVLSAAGEQARRSGFRVGAADAVTAGLTSAAAPILLALRSGTDPLIGSDDLAVLAGLVTTPLLLIDRIASHLEDLASTSPVLLAIDNVGRADEVSRSVLSVLFARLAAHPVLWLLTSDPGDPIGHDRPASTAIEVVRLGPLTVADAAALTCDRLGGVAPPPQFRLLIRSADGNPGLITRLTEDGSDRTRLPTGFVSGIQRDLARLDAQAQLLVNVLAVLGRPIAVSEIGALLDHTPDVLPSVDAATRAGLLRERDGFISVRGDLVRYAIRAGMNDRKQHLLQLRCANFLLASGYGAQAAAPFAAPAAVAGDQIALSILRQAAAEMAATEPAAAADLLTPAFRSVTPDNPGWLDLGEECLNLLVRAERARDAIRMADLLIGRATEPGRRIRLKALAARAYWLAGSIAEGVRRLGPAGGGGPLAAARSLLDGTASIGDTGDADPVIMAQGRAEAAAGRGDHHAALAHAREAGDALLGHEILSLQSLDRHDEAAVLLDRAGDATDRLPSLGYARLVQAVDLSRFDEADRVAETVIARSVELGDHRYASAATAMHVAIALLRGDLPAARHRLEAAEALVRPDASVRSTEITLVRGWLVAATGRIDEAISILSGPLYDAEQVRSSWLWRPCWLQLLTHFGLTSGDKRFTATVADIAERAAHQNPGALSLQGLAVQMRGLLDDDLAQVAHGADLLDRSPRPIVRAGAHEAYGRYLLAAGHRDEGAARLDRAWDIYRGVGAQPKLESIRLELRELGIRRAKSWGPADQPAPGWGALTEAEARVARLIADGYSNRLAARELGLSTNTIGSHLRSIFAKLDIQSRVQLANRLNQRTTPHALV